MKFMMIVKHPERPGPIPKELMDAIGKLSEDSAKEGKMIGSGGLLPTAAGARVQLTSGQIKVLDGPFTEAKEIIGGYAQFEMKSKEEAIQSAVKLRLSSCGPMRKEAVLAFWVYWNTRCAGSFIDSFAKFSRTSPLVQGDILIS